MGFNRAHCTATISYYTVSMKNATLFITNDSNLQGGKNGNGRASLWFPWRRVRYGRRCRSLRWRFSRYGRCGNDRRRLGFRRPRRASGRWGRRGFRRRRRGRPRRAPWRGRRRGGRRGRWGWNRRWGRGRRGRRRGRWGWNRRWGSRDCGCGAWGRRGKQRQLHTAQNQRRRTEYKQPAAQNRPFESMPVPAAADMDAPLPVCTQCFNAEFPPVHAFIVLPATAQHTRYGKKHRRPQRKERTARSNVIWANGWFWAVLLRAAREARLPREPPFHTRRA